MPPLFIIIHLNSNGAPSYWSYHDSLAPLGLTGKTKVIRTGGNLGRDYPASSHTTHTAENDVIKTYCLLTSVDFLLDSTVSYCSVTTAKIHLITTIKSLLTAFIFPVH